MIKIINSRRRMLVHKNTYNSPHYRHKRIISQKSREEKAKINRTKKQAKLQHLKNKNKPKRKKVVEDRLPYRFKYYQFQDHKFKNESLDIKKIKDN